MMWRGGAELSCVALGPEDREQVLEGVSQPFRVIVAEPVNDLEERAQGLRVTVGQVSVVEDVPKQRRYAGVLRHPGYGLGVQVQHFVSADARPGQLGPAVPLELPGEKFPLPAQLLGFGVDVVHELVDERDRDLLDLRLGVRHLPHEDVAGGIYAAFRVSVEHVWTLIYGIPGFP